MRVWPWLHGKTTLRGATLNKVHLALRGGFYPDGHSAPSRMAGPTFSETPRRLDSSRAGSSIS
ncbi:hypothetical protein SBA4_4440010 [Candidatus Sulfopaludibacter sp. SbA4]|nr:hypothetical protein SBA4_4440010 [Candidatus Sulfopaludibacter sp. SbA4]